MYDHNVDQTGYKWSGKSILKKINTDQLPLYIKNNKEKLKLFVDTEIINEYKKENNLNISQVNSISSNVAQKITNHFLII